MPAVRELPFVNLAADVRDLLLAAPDVTIGTSVEALADMATHDAVNGWHEVSYEVPGKGAVVEAQVCRVRNGVSVEYPEPYMRRRDPNCTFIGDENPTDHKRFSDEFGYPFEKLREETFDWLRGQKLLVFAFTAGHDTKSFDAMAIVPANAAFFAASLAMIQGIIPPAELGPDFCPTAFIFVAPPFRHTHFDGRQVVVHNRLPNRHELFSFNLYPGPSAKKGVYGMLLHQGEMEGWLTAHCSTVRVITPYDNQIVFMHEGASGGGKSEMLQYPHRESDGRLLLGQNIVTKERRFLTLPRGCKLEPVTDDMALCHRTIQSRERKLTLRDAEQAWFVRVNHITDYGTDPQLEKVTIQPTQPLVFLSIDTVPESRALIWEHQEDAPGKPCPNPRVIIPRHAFPGIVDGNVTVDIRTFGVRTPPCTKEKPSYGILGMFHLLPPALAWLWRLASPRGFDNPSIVSESTKIESEGVGSFWPFATGKRVEFANILLKQILSTPDTVFALIPNQHIGAWKVGFMPEWLCREYLARRGQSPFREDQLFRAESPLLGYALNNIHVEGTAISSWFLRVDTQPEVGIEAYKKGAQMLQEFFEEQLALFDVPELLPPGREIIQCFRDGGTVEDYQAFSKES